MGGDALRVEKHERPVRLWVHPEGQVLGSLFLRPGDTDQAGEAPLEVLNGDSPFLVVQTEAPGELRFYNKRSIVRVEYDGDGADDADDVTVIPCSLHMMDGSSFEGTIREVLPPEHQRLYDYLNRGGPGFLRMHLDDGVQALINKAYIIRAMDLS